MPEALCPMEGSILISFGALRPSSTRSSRAPSPPPCPSSSRRSSSSSSTSRLPRPSAWRSRSRCSPGPTLSSRNESLLRQFEILHVAAEERLRFRGRFTHSLLLGDDAAADAGVELFPGRRARELLQQAAVVERVATFG